MIYSAYKIINIYSCILMKLKVSAYFIDFCENEIWGNKGSVMLRTVKVKKINVTVHI